LYKHTQPASKPAQLQVWFLGHVFHLLTEDSIHVARPFAGLATFFMHSIKLSHNSMFALLEREVAGKDTMWYQEE
jgi:hypothetical protein